MGVKLITDAATEPITLAEAKLHLRVSHDVDNTPITAWIKAARQVVENYTNRQLISATWELYIDSWPLDGEYIELPMAPTTSITWVKYYNSSGDLTELAAANYLLDEISEPGRLYRAPNGSFPAVQTRRNAIIVRQVCGWADAATVPGPLKSALLLILSHLYENRQDVLTGVTAQALPKGSVSLMAPYRINRF